MQRPDRGNAFGPCDDRPDLEACLAYMKHGDTLVVWKFDHLGQSLPLLVTIINVLKDRGIELLFLTEQINTTRPHGGFPFSLAQFERALIRESVMADQGGAKRRGRYGGRQPSINTDGLQQTTKAINSGASKTWGYRSFEVPRSTLLDTLAQIGWTTFGKFGTVQHHSILQDARRF